MPFFPAKYSTPYRLLAKGLSCVRENKKLFQKITFRVHGGELLLVQGDNGTGKTTLLRSLVGLQALTKGAVYFQNAPPRAPMPHHASPRAPMPRLADHCHYIGHSHGLKSMLTVRENLLFWHNAIQTTPRRRREGFEKNIAIALTTFHLKLLEHCATGLLSQGQQRRLALTRLLLTPRPVWILDEPLAALDNHGQETFKKLLHSHLALGGMAVVATPQKTPWLQKTATNAVSL